MLGNEDEQVSGFIFMCSSNTKLQCYQYRVFGLPKGKMEAVKKIKPGTKLFLYDFDVKRLYGVYEATSCGELNIQPNAFSGKFPSQVSFGIYKDCLPVPGNVLKYAIRENYHGGSKFTQELRREQVKALMELFQPINLTLPYSNALHQGSTIYQRLPPPQASYFSRATEQTGSLSIPRSQPDPQQDAAYLYEKYVAETVTEELQYYGSQVAVTEGMNMHHPQYLPEEPHSVTDPYKRDGRYGDWYHESWPCHYNVAAQSAQSQTYTVLPQYSGHGFVSTSDTNYNYAYGAPPPPPPQYADHVATNLYHYNNSYMYQAPSQQHHEAAVVGAHQFQVYADPPQTDTTAESNVPVSSQYYM